ncbi:ornithine cyclodeaminase family protein [Streptomyces sp. SID8361]|uniref:ornithine cyclodeaminase family protein n=1 Tax=Streptomyces sp. MnatMP-M27 TaxID=1839768 RepID=UPI00081F272F|nr:ornithine cyclodeaminase family protein [Streptomyces sp. MnatMP-M27]MYU15746.1 ornithine cyclodeaminase family protein [Streptomyces sp. SID8361]SCG10217.1 ornithine cyclodeaminase [Streptomyces sp. MnatMP-M27]
MSAGIDLPTGLDGAVALIDADAVMARCSPAGAVHALVRALRAGLDPASEPSRGVIELGAGQLLLMPSELGGRSAGVKVATVAPDNPERGLPRIQGLYLLFDAATLRPTAVLDGQALTTLRTPAVSVAAVQERLRRAGGPFRVVVFGAGPQGVGHVTTLAAAFGSEALKSVHYVVRDPHGAALPPGTGAEVLAAGTAAVDDALAGADVVVCATTARTPLFDTSLLRDDVTVLAVGSHEPDARELDAGLLGRATVVVENPATALREAGDVVLAVSGGALDATGLVPMADVVTGRYEIPAHRPAVFKSVGMAWQDLVVADAVMNGGSV